jgi:hypothetical protein
MIVKFTEEMVKKGNIYAGDHEVEGAEPLKIDSKEVKAWLQ